MFVSMPCIDNEIHPRHQLLRTQTIPLCHLSKPDTWVKSCLLERPVKPLERTFPRSQFTTECPFIQQEYICQAYAYAQTTLCFTMRTLKQFPSLTVFLIHAPPTSCSYSHLSLSFWLDVPFPTYTESQG